MLKNLKQRNEQTGFTIIEVVLVLAIAGLIFLVVFLALPQLQQSRRDTQRKSDAGRLLAAFENFAGNNQGDYPQSAAELTAFLGAYTPSNFNDPSSGTAYSVTYARGTAAVIDAGNDGDFWYFPDSFCNGDVMDNPAGAQTRQVAVAVNLEQGRYCQDNQ